MIDGYDDNFSTTDRPNYIVYVKPLCKPGIYITSKWLDEKKDQYANVFIDDKPLIRCKDCKYCDRHHLVDGLFCYRLYEKYKKEYPQMIIEIDADDFCSKGERRGKEI